MWISHSLSFRARDQLLIPPAQWDSERDRYLSTLGLPNQADSYLNPLMDPLKAGLAALDEARAAGHVTIANGVLHLSPLEAAETDGIPTRTRDLLFKDIGNAQFANIILEMDARTNFSEVLLARKTGDAHELIALYAALLAHGTELDAKGVAAMIPQLDPTHISTAMRALEMPGRLRRANERVVEFQRTHPITELWGTGQRASSDSMSLDTSHICSMPVPILDAAPMPSGSIHTCWISTESSISSLWCSTNARPAWPLKGPCATMRPAATAGCFDSRSIPTDTRLCRQGRRLIGAASL